MKIFKYVLFVGTVIFVTALVVTAYFGIGLNKEAYQIEADQTSVPLLLTTVTSLEKAICEKCKCPQTVKFKNSIECKYKVIKVFVAVMDYDNPYGDPEECYYDIMSFDESCKRQIVPSRRMEIID